MLPKGMSENGKWYGRNGKYILNKKKKNMEVRRRIQNKKDIKKS